jgi:hypothetical protein
MTKTVQTIRDLMKSSEIRSGTLNVSHDQVDNMIASRILRSNYLTSIHLARLAVVASSPSKSKRFGQTKSFEVAHHEEIRGIPVRLLITQHLA